MRREQPSYCDRSLLVLPLPLTFNHNNVCLRADPLDFWRLPQFVAVGVVGSAALVRARVVEGEASDVNGASGVCYVCGVYLNVVIPSAIKELREGLVGLFALYEPPLHLGDGVPYHLAVQHGAVAHQLHLRQGRLDEAG